MKGYQMGMVATSKERWGPEEAERWHSDGESYLLHLYTFVLFVFFLITRMY